MKGLKIKLKKKRYFFIVALIIILLIPFSYVQFNKSQIYNKTSNYLLVNKKYKKDEIKSIKVSHSFFNKVLSYNEWTVKVIFNDEPNAYYYFTTKDQSITFVGVSGIPGGKDYKHTP